MRARLFLRWVGLGVAALLGAAFLGEAAVRAFDVIDRLNGYPRQLYVKGVAGLPYQMRPGMDVDVRGVRVRTNTMGLRGPEIERRAEAGYRRVLLIGDSVAFGYRLPEADGLAARLEGELERRSGARWQVVNGGVEGYDTRAELAFLRQRGFGLEPETVVLVFNLNDFDAPPVLGPRGVLTNEPVAGGCSDALAEVSELHLLLRWLVRSRGGLAAPPAPVAGPVGGPRPVFGDLDRFVSALRKRYWEEPTDGRLDAMVEALQRIRAESAARGLRLLVVIPPDGDQVRESAANLAPQQRLAGICRRLDLECLDLREAFVAEAAAGALFLDIMHPNAAGHRIMAHEIATRLLAGPLARAPVAPPEPAG